MTTSALNKALAAGEHLLLTPGVYRLSEPLRVTHAGTVVLGLGLATLVPQTGSAALQISAKHDVSIAGLIIDAGPRESRALVTVGEPASRIAGYPTMPLPCTPDRSLSITLQDLFLRIGGARPGKTQVGIEVNANHVLIDDVWVWRADHGNGVGWTQNTARTGLVVNGSHVVAQGLAVEHLQGDQVIWNGECGSTTFFQSEMPYDVPNQQAWTAAGHPAYRVTDAVRFHKAWGVGVYSFFNQGLDIHAASAIAVPRQPNVVITGAVSVKLAGTGGIDHVVNDQPGQSGQVVDLTRYPLSP